MVTKSSRRAWSVVVPGHTAHMQCVKLTGGGQTAFFFCGFSTYHGAPAASVDYGVRSYPMTTLANKKKWIPESVPARAGSRFSRMTLLPRPPICATRRRLGSGTGTRGLIFQETA